MSHPLDPGCPLQWTTALAAGMARPRAWSGPLTTAATGECPLLHRPSPRLLNYTRGSNACINLSCLTYSLRRKHEASVFCKTQRMLVLFVAAILICLYFPPQSSAEGQSPVSDLINIITHTILHAHRTKAVPHPSTAIQGLIIQALF